MNKIQLARIRAYARWPYLASGLQALRLIPTPAVETAGVDQAGRVYFNPAWVDKLSIEELVGVLVHELLHLLWRHGERRQSRDPRRWNIAADYAINYTLRQAGQALPEGGLDPAADGLPGGLLAEEYYDLLGQELPGQDAGQAGRGRGGRTGQAGTGQGRGQEQGPGPNEGSGVTGIPEPWEEGDLPPDSGAIWDRIREEVARAVRAAGVVPGGLRRWAEDELAPPRVNWRRLLRAAISGALAGAPDYTYHRPSRRQGAVRGVILPAWRPRQQVSAAVVVDTSGSIGPEELRRLLAELAAIIQAVGAAVWVVPCDARAYPAVRVGSRAEVARLELPGGGGTDMGAGIAAALELRPRPRAIVVLTDGYTGWPSQPPAGVAVIVATTAQAGPAWATNVRVEGRDSGNH